MARNTGINLDANPQADGYKLGGGTTKRILTVTGADMTLTGSGTNVYTFPGSTSVLLGISATATQGSIIFAGATLMAEDNANLFFDNTNDTLGVGTTRTGAISGSNPRMRVKGSGTTSSTSSFEVQNSSTTIFFVRDDGLVTTTGIQVVTKSHTSGVATLTDGATPALDASLGNHFLLTAAGDRTIAVPSNPTSGQKITIAHKASGANRTLALNTGTGGFRFGTDITALTATTSALTDYIGAIYNSADNKWDVVSYVKGF